ncbi:MAG TPA: ABC transporter substrate-binding protein [Bacillota bacterium]|nr:ABC transporter substrate-binding protein [Bacillota bacterium]
MKKTSFTSRLFRKTAAVSLSLALLMSTILVTGCDKRQEIVVYNWGEYIAEDTIAKFEKAYPDYKVVYREFETNETMYPNLSNSYDVIIPSEYMVARLIREEKIQEVDMSKLPNVTEYMDPMFNDMVYSQDKEISDSILNYAVPYLFCTVGLVYDANKVSLPEGTTDPATIWGVLFDQQYKNQIGMYDAMRESMGVALNFCGYSINSMDDAELEEAQSILLDQKSNITPSYGVDNLKDKMASGELVASTAWSGDHVVILDRIDELGKSDEIDLQYVLPAGSNWSVDMMCIPTNAKNVEGAHLFINFMYDPDIALANCEYVGYSTPNTAAKDMLDPTISSNLSYYPDAATFATLEVYYSSSEMEEKYTELWNTVKASS